MTVEVMMEPITRMEILYTLGMTIAATCFMVIGVCMIKAYFFPQKKRMATPYVEYEYQPIQKLKETEHGN